MAAEILKIQIDKFGRVVLPKSIRDRLGLAPGTEFEVEEQDEAILLKPTIPRAELVEKNGWLVAKSGASVGPNIIEETLESVRRQRDRQVQGEE